MPPTNPAPARSWVKPWAVAAATIALLAITFRPAIEGDGVGYYTFLHAAFVTHGFDYRDEYAAAIASHTPLYLPWLTMTGARGQLTDRFPVGSAVLSAPAYLLALAIHPSGEPQYGSPFVDAFTLASLFYALLALGICFRLAEAAVPGRRAPWVGVLGATFATPFVFYALADPSYAHTFSVFCVSAFLYAWWNGPPRTALGWIGLGALAGVMAMTRWQDAALVAIVLVDFKQLRWQALLSIPAAIVAFTPQLAVDLAQYGSLLPERPPGQALNPLEGHYVEALFSSRFGLFVWTPAAALAAAGCFLIQDRRLKLAALIAFVVEAVVIGSVPDFPGVSFGARRFLELVPFAAVGLAALAQRLGPRLGPALVGAACVWNLILVASYDYVLRGVADPGYAGLLRAQVSALGYVPRLFVKGTVLRDLVLARDFAGGLALLVLEAFCVIAAFLIVSRLRPSRRFAERAD